MIDNLKTKMAANPASLFQASVIDYFRLIEMKIGDREKEFEDLRVSHDIIIKENDELFKKNDELLEENKRLKKEIEKHNKSIAKRKHLLIDDFNTRDSIEINSSKKAKQIASEWIPTPAVPKVHAPVTSNGNYTPEVFYQIDNLDDIDWMKIPYLGDGIREYLYLEFRITNARELIEAIMHEILKWFPSHKKGNTKTDLIYICNMDHKKKISELPFLKDYPLRQGSFKWTKFVKEWILRKYVTN